MEYKILKNGFKIPVLGLGTGGIGSLFDTITFKNKKNISIIKEAIKLGFRHIDTAAIYANGYCEKLIGEAISEFNRKELFITTKVSPDNLMYNDLINSSEKSLERLKINYIDLYLIHAPNPEIKLSDTMPAMDYLIEKKLVKYIGVSNFSVEQLREAQRYAKNKIVANQIEYNLLVRNKSTNKYLTGQNIKMESEIIPYCQRNDIMVIAYRPLAKGELFNQRTIILDGLCKKYNKTRAQIGLNWLISKKNIVTIPKSTNIKHLIENLGALGWELDKEDILKLDQLNFNLRK